MRVALYLRRSTNENLQPESLLVQEERLREYAGRNNFQVVDVFADSASGLSLKGRTGFQRLIQVVQSVPAFEAILVRDVTRWGRFQNVDESAYWEVFMLLHNVKVIYAEEAFADAPQPYDSLLKAIRRIAAAEFSREKSRLIQAALASATKRGFRVNGPAPYGMRLMVVTRDGRCVRKLRRGEQKQNSLYRLKLTPGNNRATRIVRDIFRWFLKNRLSCEAIARRLNNQRIPTAHRKHWRSSTVKDILANPAYAGICRVNFKASANFVQKTVIEFRRAWRGIISERDFEAAGARFKLHALVSIDNQLRHALALWKWQGNSNTTWASTGNSFPNGAVAKDVVHSLAPEVVEEVSQFAAPFSATPTKRGFLLKNIFELGERYSFPRVYNGRLTWEFHLSTTDPEDSTLLVGLSPPPDVRPVELFLFLTRRVRRLGRTLRPEINASDFGRRHRVTWPQAAIRIERFLYSGTRAEAIVSNAMKGLTYANNGAIARGIGWPEARVYSIYQRMKNRGQAVPPLVWRAKRLITWSCDGCGKRKDMTLRAASVFKSGLCRPCYNKRLRTSRPVALDCHQCKKPRHFKYRPSPTHYPNSRPEDALCPSCCGKRYIANAQEELRRRSKLLRKAYETLSAQIAKLFKSQKPRSEPVNGMPRLLSYATPDGSRHYARILICDITTATKILNDTRLTKRIAQDMAATATTWNNMKRRDLKKLAVEHYVALPHGSQESTS